MVQKKRLLSTKRISFKTNFFAKCFLLIIVILLIVTGCNPPSHPIDNNITTDNKNNAKYVKEIVDGIMGEMGASAESQKLPGPSWCEKMKGQSGVNEYCNADNYFDFAQIKSLYILNNDKAKKWDGTFDPLKNFNKGINGKNIFWVVMNFETNQGNIFNIIFLVQTTKIADSVALFSPYDKDDLPKPPDTAAINSVYKKPNKGSFL